VQARARIDSREKRRAEAIAAARTDALQRKADALRRIVAAEQQIRRETQRREDRVLRAPVAGVVTGQSAFTVGGVVTTKDVIMRVVPEGATLEAEVMVLNKDIGFVEVGQPVELKLETFPFTRYGVIEGRVKQVWRDAIQDEKQGLVYKAEVTLAADRILVDRTWVPLATGMAVQAEIKTGDRRVISYFLSPLLRYRDESLRER
jgi:HlyD family type I secretion membrane fusion protein